MIECSQEEFFLDLDLLPEQKLYAATLWRSMEDIRLTVKYIKEGHYNINCFRRERDYLSYTQKRGYQLSNEDFKTAIEYTFSDRLPKFFSAGWHLENIFPDGQAALHKLRKYIKSQLVEAPIVYSYYNNLYNLDKY